MAAMLSMCYIITSATNVDSTNDTAFTYNLLNMDALLILFTTFLVIFLGALATGFWRHAADPEAVDPTGPFAEEEPLQEDSNPATAPVEAETQTDFQLNNMITMEEHYKIMERMALHIEEETVPRYVYDAMMATHWRELDTCYEEMNRQLGVQERQHRANLHNLTHGAVFFTRQGRCWHADPACLQRFATTEIMEKGYCTRCAHTLSGILPLGQPDEESQLVDDP